MLSALQIAHFEEHYGNLIRELGYETAGTAPSPGNANTAPAVASEPAATDNGAAGAIMPGPDVVVTTQDAMARLSADGAAIRPTAVNHGTYAFVV
jgi:hypothetical protein